jgi:hypothetical protein
LVIYFFSFKNTFLYFIFLYLFFSENPATTTAQKTTETTAEKIMNYAIGCPTLIEDGYGYWDELLIAVLSSAASFFVIFIRKRCRSQTANNNSSQAQQQFLQPPAVAQQQFAPPPAAAQQQFAPPAAAQQQFAQPPAAAQQQFAQPPAAAQQQFAEPPAAAQQQQQLVRSQLKVVPLALTSSSHQSPFAMSPSIQRKNQQQMQHTQQMQMNHIRIYTPPPSPSSSLSASYVTLNMDGKRSLINRNSFGIVNIYIIFIIKLRFYFIFAIFVNFMSPIGIFTRL